ncbi:uncharacterized protein LOC143281279 [Babylonia areolata]|uniref:uncharacterized protein LOC143281279 n=1 Tax=Babylonia areolata TaxID=304850 RepID=UPI003FD3C577
METAVYVLVLLMAGVCPLQAMVLLSPPAKQPTGSELERVLNSLDKQELNDLNNLDLDDLDLLSFDDLDQKLPGTSGVGATKGEDVDGGASVPVSSDAEGAKDVVGDSSLDTTRRNDTTQLLEPPVDTLVLPDPERVLTRIRRSSPRRPTKPSLRIGVHTRKREQRRRTRNKNRNKQRRGRIGGRRVIGAKVELLVVVENSIYRKFLANNQNNRQAALARIRRYYGIVVAMMDQRFHTIEDRRLSIMVRISGIIVAETREDSGWLEKLADWSNVGRHNGRASVNTDKALFDFSQWVKAQHLTLPKFDHAMVFSGYRLSNRYDISFGGKAYLGAICDTKNGNSVSIVSDTGDFQCVKVATHELAHSLGSVHDGDPGFESCPAKGNYVMAPVATHDTSKLRNAFFFSRCSVKQMKKLLRSKKAACVRDEPTVYYKYDLQRFPPGKMISPDQHCQMIYGPKSTFCNEYDVQVVVCGQLWCRDPNMNGACRTNSYLTALPGTPCNKDMSCHLGECLANSVIQERTSRNRDHSRKTSSSSSSSSSSSTPSSSSSSSRKPPSSTRKAGGEEQQEEMDNTIPTVPQSVIRGRVGRRPGKPNRDHGRRGSRSRSGRRRSRSRSRSKSRRRGRCKADQPDMNVTYCRGLVTLNPGACKRRAIKNYCCRTCAFRR